MSLRCFSSRPCKTQVLGGWAMGLIHKMLVKFSNPAAKPPPYTGKEALRLCWEGLASLQTPLTAAHGCQGGDGIAGRGMSPSASPTGGRDLVWAALGHRSVAGEPADQHEVQVHQIHGPRHQPGADPHHRRYPAGHSLPEEGDHVSGKPGNQFLRIAHLCTGAKVPGGEAPKCWGDPCFPI